MIIVEDGTCIAGANSYASVSAATAFHELRLNEAWFDATTEQQVSALVRATDYIEARYNAPFPRLNPAQGLQWPVSASQGLPAPLVTATTTLALYALSGPLSAPVSRGIKSTKEALDGVASEEIVYDDVAPFDPYPDVTAMLASISTPIGLGTIVEGRLAR